MIKAIVIVPTFNERDNIGLLVDEILALPVEVGMLVVDDNSPDGTGDLADRLSAAHPDRVYVLHRPAKMGLGTAYIAGFKKALEMGVSRILTMDADFSHPPRYIPAMLQASEAADVVIGSRYVSGGGAEQCTLARKVLSRGANGFAHLMLGLRARDTTAGFRCYRREVLDSIDLDGIRAEGYSFLIEMLFRCQQAGWRVGEVPIVFVNRLRGASKISREEILKAMLTVLRLAPRRFVVKTSAKTISPA
ncbi:MAG: polyprenol monophosphomannose synthase [Chloroflexota bacterium]